MGIPCCAVSRACNNVCMSVRFRLGAVALLTGLSILLGVVGFVEAVSSTLPCPNLTKTLKRGSAGDDVKRLQQFLAQDPGVYPEGQITSTYGPATEAAVKRWQAKFNIVTTGDPASTGFGMVGARTMAAMAKQCAAAPGVAASAAPSTGGLLSVTPISGPTPLTVTIEAVVNTANVCGGATYDVDYGDGSLKSQIVVPAGNCAQVTKSFSHVYRNRGSYQISLAAGSHRTAVGVTAN